MTTALLEVSGLYAGYDRLPVVRGADIRVEPGEVVTLLGSNGAGKTTTLLTISGLLPILGGAITLFGDPMRSGRRVQPRDVWMRSRSGVAHVAEDRSLFFDLTARENIRLGAARRSPRGVIDEVIDLFPPLRPILDRAAGLLSGGEQQMVAMARALAARPRLLMVDEMSLGLAPIIVEQLMPVLRSVAKEAGVGVLVVEQHVPLVLSVADRAYVMTRGTISTQGSAKELLERPDLLEAGYLGS